MKLDFEGSGPAYKSYMGAFISSTYVFMVLIFLYSKLIILVEDSETRITSTLIESGLD